MVALPDGCEGLFLAEGIPPPDVDTSKKFFEVRGTFNEVHAWSHDRDLTPDHPTQRALDWIELSSAIHDL